MKFKFLSKAKDYEDQICGHAQPTQAVRFVLYMNDISEKMEIMEKHAENLLKENEELKALLPKLYKHMSGMVERLRKYENN
jgi:tRNA-dihydrouridine synthase